MEKIYFIGFIALLTAIAYVLLIACFCYGWMCTKSNYPELTATIKVSIIIAARNEAANIIPCLQSIVHQSYSKQDYEIMVVDDGSTDLTSAMVASFCNTYSFIKLVTLNETGTNAGKKRAIEKAVELATGELIITVDADCTMNKNWLSTVAAYYNHTKAQMIVGPVCFDEEHTVFEKMQSLEFMSLVASGAGALYFHQAIMCNGANLIYTKKAFEAVGGFKGVEHIASGDDVLLMYKIKKKYPRSIHFLKHREAIVYTKAKKTIADFIDQRRRWSSKGFLNFNRETKIVAVLVYSFNFLLVVLPFFDFIKVKNNYFPYTFFEIALVLLLIKCVIDFLLLFLTASFFKKRQFLIYFIPEQLIYLFYVLFMGFLGSVGTYTWKDRKIKK